MPRELTQIMDSFQAMYLQSIHLTKPQRDGLTLPTISLSETLQEVEAIGVKTMDSRNLSICYNLFPFNPNMDSFADTVDNLPSFFKFSWSQIPMRCARTHPSGTAFRSEDLHVFFGLVTYWTQGFPIARWFISQWFFSLTLEISGDFSGQLAVAR